MSKTVDQFVDAIIDSGTYQPLDRIYVTNKVLGFVGDAQAVDAKSDDLLDVLDALLETAVQNGKIEDSQTDKDILEAQLTDLMTQRQPTLMPNFGTSTTTVQKKPLTTSTI